MGFRVRIIMKILIAVGLYIIAIILNFANELGAK